MRRPRSAPPPTLTPHASESARQAPGRRGKSASAARYAGVGALQTEDVHPPFKINAGQCVGGEHASRSPAPIRCAREGEAPLGVHHEDCVVGRRDQPRAEPVLIRTGRAQNAAEPRSCMAFPRAGCALGGFDSHGTPRGAGWWGRGRGRSPAVAGDDGGTVGGAAYAARSALRPL